MKRIFLDKLNRDFELELCKVNKDVVCYIPKSCLESLTRSLTEVDSMEIIIKKYISSSNGKTVLNPIWKEIKEERLICLNSSEYFVIKVNNFKSTENELVITAYSLEYKLGKIDISVEDVYFCLMTEDKENYIINVSDTGCGFDPSKPKDDGKIHVGIENVRQRLANMCEGSLTIESEIGAGTVAVIKIPKGVRK